MANKKILVNLWVDLARGFKKKTDRAFLKRDMYLDAVLRHEATRLETEVAIPNSEAARTYIAQSLNTLDRKPVNLMLSEETIKLMNEACERKNLPRDAFIHRVLLFLLLGQKSMENLITVDWEWARNKVFEQGSDELYKLVVPSTLLAIGDIVEGDPFWFMRECLYHLRNEGHHVPTLLGAFLSKNALSKTVNNSIGFNCYVPDREVEGTLENIEHRERVDELLRFFEEGL